MNYNLFTEILKKRNGFKNIGLDAHLPFYPSNRKIEIEKGVINKTAAVLVLFFPKNNNETNLVMIKRSNFGVHANQMAFPGGKKELKDQNLVETALRETEEEIGVHRKDIEIIHELTPVTIPVSQTKMHAFIGLSDKKIQFRKNSEIQKIHYIPLDFIQNIEKNIKNDLNIGPINHIPYVQLGEEKIWGASVMVLNEVKELLKRNLESH